MKVPVMDGIARQFKDHGVVFYMLYTREPHAGHKMGPFDFSEKKQTESHQERVDYALEMIKERSQYRPILIDTFGEKCLQRTIGGSMPNSLIVVDRQGRVALWQEWSNPKELRKKLVEMTGYEPPPPPPAAEQKEAAEARGQTPKTDSGSTVEQGE